jgi:hypothetical protein
MAWQQRATAGIASGFGSGVSDIGVILSLISPQCAGKERNYLQKERFLNYACAVWSRANAAFSLFLGKVCGA